MSGDTERNNILLSACDLHIVAVHVRFTFPYSKSYATDTVGPGSLPFFLTRTKPTPRRRARRGPNRKPRASKPAHKQYKKPLSEISYIRRLAHLPGIGTGIFQ